MTKQRIEALNAVVYGLAGDLSRDLFALLASICNVRFAAASGSLAGMPADVIFCGPDVAVVQQLKVVRPDAPIIVVSPHAEVCGWLDSIEAGASDYCVAPFEYSQVMWILESTRHYFRS
jgi:hypothetical protein